MSRSYQADGNCGCSCLVIVVLAILIAGLLTVMGLGIGAWVGFLRAAGL